MNGTSGIFQKPGRDAQEQADRKKIVQIKYTQIEYNKMLVINNKKVKKDK